MVRVLPTRAELRAPSSPSFQTITQSERGAFRTDIECSCMASNPSLDIQRRTVCGRSGPLNGSLPLLDRFTGLWQSHDKLRPTLAGDGRRLAKTSVE